MKKEMQKELKELKDKAREVKEIIRPSDFPTFQKFYPFYLQEHSNTTNRRLHVIGTSFASLLLLFLLFTKQWNLLYLPLIVGYGFAWVGHFFFEKNKPATFKYPLFSLRGDWVMLYQTLTGKIPF